MSRTARNLPVTIGFSAVVLLGSALVWRSPSVPPVEWRLALRGLTGSGYEEIVTDGHWWAMLTGSLAADTPLGLLMFLVLGIPALAIAERALRPARTLLALVTTTVAGAALAIGLQALGRLGGEVWTGHVAGIVAFDPLAGMLGALTASSAFRSVLWRRRIRAVVLTGCLLMLLYSGLPQDLSRLLAAAAGIPLGMALTRGSRGANRLRSSHHEIRVLLATIVAMMGIGPIITILSGRHLGPLAPLVLLLEQNIPDTGQAVEQCRALGVSPQCLHDLTLVRVNSAGGVLLSIVPMVALLFAAWGLLRGRRFAVWFAAAVMIVFAGLGASSLGAARMTHSTVQDHGGRGHSIEIAIALVASIVLPLVVAGLLIAFRRGFPVHSTARSVTGYLVIVGGSWLVLATTFALGAVLLRDGFSPPPDLGAAILDTPERFIPAAYLRHLVPGFIPVTAPAGVLLHSVGPLWWTIILLAAIWPLKRVVDQVTPDDDRRLRSLLAQGSDSIGYMATWPGNRIWFDPDHQAGIAYRVIAGVAVTTGGCFGHDRHQAAAVGRFIGFCEDEGWTVAFYSVDAPTAEILHEFGWRTVQVAEETRLHPAAWNPVGKKWQDIRSSVNRAGRAGITAVWSSYGELGLGTASQIAEISEEWVADRSLPEMGFTLGGFDELVDDEVRLLIAVDGEHRVHGVTSWLPVRREGAIVGWTLDFMRRRPDGVNGVMEFLIAEAATRFKATGIEEMSLSAAPLARSAGAPDDGTDAISRFLEYLGDTLEPVYGFRSLLAFKSKFQPEERPLVLGYADPLTLPAIGLAVGRAYLPDVPVRTVATMLRN